MQKLLELLSAGWVLTQLRRPQSKPSHYAVLPNESDSEAILITADTISRCTNAGLITFDPVFGYILSGKPWHNGFYTVELETP